MPFELTQMTTVRILDVRTLAAKNREPGDLVGAQLLLRSTLPIASLAMFDPALPAMFARKAKPKVQGQLEGVEEVELTEIGQHVKSMPWVYDQSGNTIEIDRGLGGSSNLRLVDCTVHSVSWKVQEGVSATYTWTVDAPSLAETIRGKLTSLKRTEIPITQVAPSADDGQQDLAPAPRLTPGQLRQVNADGKTVEQKAAEVKGAAGMKPAVAWPFPQDGRPGSGPNAKSVPQDATAAVLADVKKNGPGHSANPKPKAKRAAPVKLAKPPAKYRDPQSGQTWTGRGLKPKWLTVALERGAKLADFEVRAH
ncbi:MAG: hypothetical protein PVS3B2_00520 [Candidatus Dormibacteraceae bacterium]